MKRLHILAIGLLIAFAVSLQAVQSVINVGSSANDGTGDTLRSAMQKVNSNFTELYGTIFNFDGNQFSATASTNIFIKSGATLTNSVIYGSTSGSWTFGSTGNLNSSAAATLGVGTSSPDKALDVNSTTGACLQLTYNDSNGSASNKATFDVSSGGNLSITPSGGFIGIGGATPTHALTIPTSSTGIAIYNTADQTTNLERGLIQWSGNTLNIQAASAGSGVLRKVRLLSGGSSVEAVGNATPFVSLTPATSSTTGNFIQASTSSGGLTGSSGTQVMLAVVPTYNQTGTAGGTDLLINRTQTAIGSGSHLLFDAQVSASSKFSVNNAGAVVFAGYLASGVQSLSGAGAVNVTTGITELTSTGVAQAITLGDGVAGQEKTIIHGVDGGSMVLTPTTKTGFSTVTFTTVGESVTLVFLATRGWCVKSSYLATIAP